MHARGGFGQQGQVLCRVAAGLSAADRAFVVLGPDEVDERAGAGGVVDFRRDLGALEQLGEHDGLELAERPREVLWGVDWEDRGQCLGCLVVLRAQDVDDEACGKVAPDAYGEEGGRGRERWEGLYVGDALDWVQVDPVGDEGDDDAFGGALGRCRADDFVELLECRGYGGPAVLWGLQPRDVGGVVHCGREGDDVEVRGRVEVGLHYDGDAVADHLRVGAHRAGFVDHEEDLGRPDWQEALGYRHRRRCALVGFRLGLSVGLGTDAGDWSVFYGSEFATNRIESV